MSIGFDPYKAREAGGITVNNLSGAIGGVVIGDEKGEICVGLSEKGL
jgi:hypothetical protein